MLTGLGLISLWFHECFIHPNFDLILALQQEKQLIEAFFELI